MTQTLDCKNLTCPQPVLKTKEALAALPFNSILDVELNSYSSVANVRRFAKNQGIYIREKSRSKEVTILTFIKGGTEEISVNKSFYALISGSLIMALLASTCCLTPLLFLVFGVSVGSLSFLQIFAPYTMVFSIFSIITIAYLWYNYFYKIKRQLVCSTSLCKNYKFYLIVGTVFVSILVTYPSWANYLLE